MKAPLLFAPVACALLLVDAAADGRKFAPEVEAKFAELLEKVGAAKADAEAKQMEAELDELAKTTGLDAARRKSLEEAAASAVTDAARDWKAKMADFLRKNWTPEVAPGAIESGLANSANFLNLAVAHVKSSDQPAWTDSLSQALRPGETAAWKAVLENREQEIADQIKGVVGMNAERARAQYTSAISAVVSGMKTGLSLDEERAGRLEKLGEKAVEKSVEESSERARQILRNYDPAHRRQIAGRNGFHLAPDGSAAPEKQAVWTGGLAEILAPAEIARWESLLKKRAERERRALADLFVTVMDEAVALTSAQRERLQPIAGRLFRERAGSEAGSGAQARFNNATPFYQIGARAEEAELDAILDPDQMKRWMAICNPARRSAQSARDRDSSERFQAEDLEEAISDYLHAVARREQASILAETMLRSEDVIRVALVDEPAAARLRTAARGAMDRILDQWRISNGANMRGQLEKTTPAELRVRVDNLAGYRPQRRLPGKNEAPMAAWERTVRDELTEPQKEAWESELAAREAHRHRAIVRSLLVSLDRLCALADDQTKQLEPLLDETLGEYASDIESFLSASGPNQWFLNNYYVLIPLIGIPEKTLREILSEEQWKQWSASNFFTNGTNYWKTVESRHKARMKKTPGK